MNQLRHITLGYGLEYSYFLRHGMCLKASAHPNPLTDSCCEVAVGVKVFVTRFDSCRSPLTFFRIDGVKLRSVASSNKKTKSGLGSRDLSSNEVFNESGCGHEWWSLRLRVHPACTKWPRLNLGRPLHSLPRRLVGEGTNEAKCFRRFRRFTVGKRNVAASSPRWLVGFLKKKYYFSYF